MRTARATEEQRGVIHWLRPDYQIKALGGTSSTSPTLNLPEGQAKRQQKSGTRGARPSGKSAWPKTLADRVKAVEAALHAAGSPMAAAELAKQFKRAQPADAAEILETLVTLGRARRQGGQFMR